MKDYYAILEVNENASKETIDKVYKLMVKKYHPDLQEGDKRIHYEEKLKEINEAYEILTNEDKKIVYNEELKEYRMQEIMKEIRRKQMLVGNTEHYEEYESSYDDPYTRENANQEVGISDEEIRRQAQVYYDELYKQYLYYNGYVKEDFKTKLKRYIAVFLTIILLPVAMYILYKIPYFNSIFSDIVNSNELLKDIVERFF